MDPIAVSPAKLRNQLPDVPLREGATMMARVASRGEGNAVIVIAGMPLTAQVPPEVPAGATLRLRIQEVSAQRVILQIQPPEGEEAPPTSQPAPPPPPGGYARPAPLPGQAQPQPPAPGQQPAAGQPQPAAPRQPAQPTPGQPGQPAAQQAPGQPAPGAPPGQAAPPPAPGQPAPPQGQQAPAQPTHDRPGPVPGQPHGAPAQPAAAQPDAVRPADTAAARPAEAQPQLPSPTASPITAGPPVPMELRPHVQVEEAPQRRHTAEGEPTHTVSLAFNSPTLGRLDLRLELRGERVLADVTTPAGRPHAVASSGAERLRANLEAAGLEATVKVRARGAPLDLYA